MTRVLRSCLGVILLSGAAAPALAQDGYQRQRYKMVEEQVEREGIKNPVVLAAMREVPRHMFVAEKYRADAYNDQIISIGYKQTLSTAYIVGYMTEALDPQPADRVLEIGTGSGYQAAVLGKIVKEVYSIEIVEPLGREAAARLKELGFANVKTKVGDGYKGWPEAAPFDKIIVTCSPEDVPRPLVEQLKEGGRMIVPLGERYQQAFYLFEKRAGQLVKTKLLPTLFVPMTGAAEQSRRVKTDGAHPKIVNGGFEQHNNGVPEGWFYQRQATLESKPRPPEGKHYLTFTNKDEGRESMLLQAVGIDGSRVASVSLSVRARGEDIRPGRENYERAGLSIQFYDVDNKQLGEKFLGPWIGTFAWTKQTVEARVPPKTVMSVVRVGLNGSTGKLSVDDIRMVSRGR